MSNGDAPERDVRYYLRILRARKWIVMLATVLVVGAAVAVALLQTPMYAANAEVLLRPNPQEGALLGTDNRQQDSARSIPTEIQLLQSKPVRDRVRAQLGTAPRIKVSQVGETELLRLRAEQAKPVLAARVANTYAQQYIEYRRDQIVEGLTALTARLQGEIDADQAKINLLNLSLAGLQPGAQPTAAQQQQISERDTVQRRLIANQDAVAEAQASAQTAAGQAQLVTPAAVPADPFQPKPIRTGLLALVIGLCFGAGLALLVDYLDDSVKTTEDVDRATGGLNVLGAIPLVPGWKDRKETHLVAREAPSSLPSEAYRAVRTSVQFLGLDRPLRTLQITSPAAREGKTTTLSNLAVTLANAGQRVVVVCCDLRKPRVHEFFGLSNAVGFTSVLLGEVPLSDAVQSVPGIDGLQLLASGPPPPNPSELLAGHRTVELLTALQATYDIVLIDCPPVLPVTDAAALSHRVDATLLVCTAGTTTKKALRRATELLRQVDAPLIGVVLNGVSEATGYGYGYGYAYGYSYGHGYYRDDEKPRRSSRKQRRQQRAAGEEAATAARRRDG